MQAMGYTLNFIVLFSLILALGMLVDNAIVVVENIYRHMQGGKNRFEAVDWHQGSGWSDHLFNPYDLGCFRADHFYAGDYRRIHDLSPTNLDHHTLLPLFVGLFINPVLCSTMMKVSSKKSSSSEDELAILKNSRFLQGYLSFMKGLIRLGF